jgi:hypothetical protein
MKAVGMSRVQTGNVPWHLDRIDQRSRSLDGNYTYSQV